jgi:hypothetical protein
MLAFNGYPIVLYLGEGMFKDYLMLLAFFLDDLYKV